jgi:hypothetical protein
MYKYAIILSNVMGKHYQQMHMEMGTSRNTISWQEVTALMNICIRGVRSNLQLDTASFILKICKVFAVYWNKYF